MKSWSQLSSQPAGKFWHRLARSVRQVSPGVVEIPRYYDRRLRVAMSWLAVLIYGLTPFYILNSFGSFEAFFDRMHSDYRYVFYFEEVMREHYYDWITLQEAYETPEDFIKSELTPGSRHLNRFRGTFAMLLVIELGQLSLILMPLFWPRYAAIRLDRNRMIVYTYYRKQLYIADVSHNLVGINLRLENATPGYWFLGHDTIGGPLEIVMHLASNPAKKRSFWMGIYPATHGYQSTDLAYFMFSFFSNQQYDEAGNATPWSGEWLDKLDRGPNRFWRDFDRARSGFTLGPKRDLDEAKLEHDLGLYLMAPKDGGRGIGS